MCLSDSSQKFIDGSISTSIGISLTLKNDRLPPDLKLVGKNNWLSYTTTIGIVVYLTIIDKV